MAKGSEIPFKLPSVDELFTTQEERDDAKREKVFDIPLSEIDPFPDHPFQVRMDDEMRDMVESVRRSGVLHPVVVRTKEDGRYELLSGHRRHRACELAGMDTLPAIVREMSDDAAIVFMVDSNLQREHILPSEKAKSYKMKLEAIKRQGGRPPKKGAPMVPNFAGLKSTEVLGQESGESHEQVRRYIRLNELIPEILDMVDEGKMAFRPAVEVSYLPKEQQRSLLDTMEMELCTPSLAQAIKLKAFSQDGRLNPDVMSSILKEEKPNQKKQFRMPRDKLARYFEPGTPAQKMEETIIKALELYRRRERGRDDAR